jgi:site-specific recombinase XerD
VLTGVADVAAWLAHLRDDRDLSERSIWKALSVVRSWFRWLMDQQLMSRQAVTRGLVRTWRVDQVRVVRGDGTRQALTVGEAQAALRWAMEQAEPAIGVSIALQLCCGLRSAEVATATRDGLREVEGVWSMALVGKGNRLRRIVWEPAVVAAWERYQSVRRIRGGSGPLLIRPGGGAYSTRAVQRWAKDAAVAIGRGADISSHDLRRTHATLLMEHGAPLEAVQGRLGHASAATTQRCYVTRPRPLAQTTGLMP